MNPVDFEKFVPGLAEERAQERHNRALAFAGITHTVCGQEILPLTPGHRLQLQLLQNAFTTVGAYCSLQDVFVFLWVLSPHNVGGLEAARQQVFLREDVLRLDLPNSVAEISRYLVDQLQDALDGAGAGEGKDHSAWIHWMAMDAAFWMTQYGFSYQEYQRTPFMVLQQLFRAWKVNHPDMERMPNGSVIVRDPIFRNASDRMVSAFHRQHRDAALKIILSQKERRN